MRDREQGTSADETPTDESGPGRHLGPALRAARHLGGRVADEVKSQFGAPAPIDHRGLALTPDQRLLYCRVLASHAAADGTVDPRELGNVYYVAGQLGLDAEARRRVLAEMTGTRPAASEEAPGLAAALSAGLAATGGGNSMIAGRALLMAEPASIDAGEITDKAYINQRAVLNHRAALVERLYAAAPDSEVVVAARTKSVGC